MSAYVYDRALARSRFRVCVLLPCVRCVCTRPTSRSARRCHRWKTKKAAWMVFVCVYVRVSVRALSARVRRARKVGHRIKAEFKAIAHPDERNFSSASDTAQPFNDQHRRHETIRSLTQQCVYCRLSALACVCVCLCFVRDCASEPSIAYVWECAFESRECNCEKWIYCRLPTCISSCACVCVERPQLSGIISLRVIPSRNILHKTTIKSSKSHLRITKKQRTHSQIMHHK